MREKWLARLSDQSVLTIVAEVDGKVAGYARLKQGSGRGFHTGEISVVAIRPEWQGRGIGTQLIKTLLEAADSKLQLKRLRLTVHADNPTAQRMYETLGFEIEGRERKAAYKDGKYVDILIMGRLRD